MKTLFCFSIIVGCALLAGCGDGGSGSGDATNTSSGNPLTAPVDYLGAVDQARQASIKTVDVATLTKAIQMFQVEEDRLPKDLDELVAKKYIAEIPKPPHGKKIVYDASTGTVKVVAE